MLTKSTKDDDESGESKSLTSECWLFIEKEKLFIEILT